MARFGSRRETPDNGVDPDRPTRNDIERAARSEDVQSIADLAERLDVTKDRARTLAMDVAVYDQIRDACPGDAGEEEGGNSQ